MVGRFWIIGSCLIRSKLLAKTCTLIIIYLRCFSSIVHIILLGCSGALWEYLLSEEHVLTLGVVLGWSEHSCSWWVPISMEVLQKQMWSVVLSHQGIVQGYLLVHLKAIILILLSNSLLLLQVQLLLYLIKVLYLYLLSVVSSRLR